MLNKRACSEKHLKQLPTPFRGNGVAILSGHHGGGNEQERREAGVGALQISTRPQIHLRNFTMQCSACAVVNRTETLKDP